MRRIAPFTPGPLVFERYMLGSDVSDVQMLGVRQIVQEREDQQRVRPPARCRGRACERVAPTMPPSASRQRERRPARTPTRRRARARTRTRSSESSVTISAADHRQDDDRVARVRPCRPGAAAAARRAGGTTRTPTAREHEQREQLLRQRVETVERRAAGSARTERREQRPGRGSRPCRS